MLAKIYAILSTLEETNGCPESTLYIFFGMDIHLWNKVRNILIAEKLIQISNHYVTLTELGHEKAKLLNARLNHVES